MPSHCRSHHITKTGSATHLKADAAVEVCSGWEHARQEAVGAHDCAVKGAAAGIAVVVAEPYAGFVYHTILLTPW